MSEKETREKAIQALRKLYREKRGAIRRRLSEFSSVAPSDYFYELAYCLLTPQSSAERADRVVEMLRKASFRETGIDPEPFLRERSCYIRFHRTKARHLLLARKQASTVIETLGNGHPASELREWLVRNVKGLGYKEATHFLRNIGKNNGLAILDRHILRNLKRHGVLRSIPSSLSRTKYLAIERRFGMFAERIGIPVDELDLLFWSMETGSIRK